VLCLLTAWVVSGLPAGEQGWRWRWMHHAQTEVVVLTVIVLYCGVAIPIAWQVFAAIHGSLAVRNWLMLLEQLSGRLPADGRVAVLADRGLYATWLFEAIQKHGWHPFPAHQPHRSVSPAGPVGSIVAELVPANGQTFNALVDVFKNGSLRPPC